MNHKIVKKRKRVLERNQMKVEKMFKEAKDLIQRANELQVGRKAIKN